MLASSLLTILAAGAASLVAAQSTTDGTTTSTATQTQTITITRCNPAVTNCPANNSTSSSAWYPISNSTSSSGPTAYPNTSTTYVISSAPATTQTSVVIATTAPTSTPSTVPASGASGLIVQSGLLLGALAAGIAALA